MNMKTWIVGQVSQLFANFSHTQIKVKKKKNKLIVPKLPSLQWAHCAFLILFVFILAFKRAVLYENVVFSILVLSNKKWGSF